ncbi:fibrinogen-like YCDxxxxGGGW domain-containing protein [Amycolatopsis sp. GM8]|uniref:fibrinogen-like YCDxxxxGGGW domain-containing protein n=1 Tax=Amycolatopsis sp. GM8 TaxID=2896530 RepID=UPI001F2A2E01|nr:fibrinogen-like YCDxxxxGGGW domain-containing protein [Amycolatopsis sp. GM8]
MTRHRPLTAALVVLAAALVVAPGTASAAPARTGATTDRAAASCWEIKQEYPSSPSGIYWLQTPKLVAPQQFYCDQSTDGGGWVLVGRGRDDWQWTHNGQGTPQALREVVDGPGAFTPAALPAETINGLLDGGRPDALPDGVRVRRAANTDGNNRQELRLRLDGAADWSWAFGGGIKMTGMSANGTDYPAGHTRDYWGTPNDDGYTRLATYETPRHNWRMGFGYGLNVHGGSAANSYLWEAGTEGQALGFAQVFVRPKVTSPSYPAIPREGTKATTVRPLMKTTTEPMPWGVTGLLGVDATKDKSELNMEVEDIAFIGNTAYVGGKFLNVQKGPSGPKQPQSYLAAFDVKTGEWRSGFRPTLDGTVWSLAASPDGKLLVGGQFKHVNGKAGTQSLAELDPGSGAVVADWNTQASYGTNVSNVRTMDVQDGWLYVGGSFNQISGGKSGPVTVGNAARIRLADDTPDGQWKPHFDGPVYELDASARGDRVYYAGRFNNADFTASPMQATVSTAAGAPLAPGMKRWVPSTEQPQYQQTVMENGDHVWLGGSEHILGMYNRSDFSYVTSDVTRPGGDFQALAEIDGVVYGGCHCDKWDYSGTTGPWGDYPILNRTDVDNVNLIAAYDAKTGEFLPQFFLAGLRGRNTMGPWALRKDPNGCLWFGGDFVRGTHQGNGYQWLGGFGKVCGRDTTAPVRPHDLQVERANGTVTATWTAGSDASGPVRYEVLRDDRVIATTSALSWTSTDSRPAVYWVRAIDDTGNRSDSTAGWSVG